MAVAALLVGIVHVPRAAGLRRFEVRYYKQAEEAGAQRIVTVIMWPRLLL